MQSQNVTVPSSTGLDLAATIDFPDAAPRAFAVFSHCFAGSRHTPGAARVSKRLAEHGIATIRFDYPGLGQSAGEFADTSFSQNVDDLVAVFQWMEQNYEAPQLLMGHSLGGAAALKAATRPELKALKAVATIGAPFDPAHSVLHYADRIKEADETGAVTVVLGGKDLVISKPFLEDLADTNPEAYLPLLRKPLLLLHSPIDQTVGIDNAQTIYLLTRYPKSLVSLDKADHLVTRQGVAQRAADQIAHWADQYLTPADVPDTSDGRVESRVARGTRMGDVVYVGGQELGTDLPKKEGGKGQGLTPTQLAMSALAAATSEAIRKAGKKDALDDVRVTVTSPENGVFERRIVLIGNLDDAARSRLMDAGRAVGVVGNRIDEAK